MRRSRRNDPLRLRDIVEAIDRIERWHRAGAAAREMFAEELGDMYRSAVMRELAVIGEAALALSDAVLREHPEIPWREMRGFRNRAVHEYWDTDWAIIEKLVARDLPALRRVAEPIAAPPPPDAVELVSAAASRQSWSAPGPGGGDVGACGAWMPLARAGCALPRGHAGHHRSRRWPATAAGTR